MDERFHLLDQQIAKFTEFGVIVVFSTEAKVDLLRLRNTSQKLAAQWPILRARINILDHQPRDGSGIQIAWQSKTLDHTLGAFLPDLNQELPQFNGSIESLFAFGCAWSDTISPSALSMSAIILRDACLLRFSVQHVLCDATGLNNIVRAYCSLLRGELLQPPNPRPALDLMDRHVGIVSKLPCMEPLSADLAQFQITTSRVGWRPVLGVVLQNAFAPPKRSKTCRIPLFNERLLTNARMSNNNVTAHDVLMAHIWKASAASPSWKQQQRDESMYPPFSFALNIERFLECSSELHNRWVVVNVPDLTRTTNEEDEIVRMALHIRSTITNARSLAYIQPVLNHYQRANGAPIMPWKDGLSAGLFCSSWGKTPLYDMSFDLQGTPEKQPVHVQPFVRPSPFLRLLRQKVHNTVLTWTDRKHRFWIHGSLDEEVWLELDRLSPQQSDA